jgi:hypothetical protein
MACPHIKVRRFLVARQAGRAILTRLVRRAAEVVKVGRHHTAKWLTWKMNDTQAPVRSVG